MRILHVSSEYPPQKVFGLGRYVSDLARELVVQGHETHVLTNSLGKPAEDVTDRGVQVHRVDAPPPPMPPTPGAPVMAFNVHLQQRARSLGRKGLGDPEVVVSHDWLTALAGHRIAHRLDLPHVWTTHDTVYGKRFGVVEEVEDRIAFALERWAARKADLVLANSEAIGDEVIKVYKAPADRVALLHPGIDVAASESTQDDSRIRAFRSCIARPDEVLVTFAGRLDLEKGVDTLINAFKILRGRLPVARLAIAGRGVLQQTIETHVQRLGLGEQVTFCGYLEGEVLKAFYRASDIHVCPSYYEPFGLVALEAMAAGTPTVVSDTGGLRDIVSSAKVGRRVPPKDAQALADTLFELAQSPKLRTKIGLAGSAHVRRQFSWSRLALRSVELYQRTRSSPRELAV